MIDFTQFDSLVTVADYFVDEKTCKQALTEARWGYDIVCPNCGKHHCARRSDGRFRCQACDHNFSCTTETIFENTKLPLRKWFLAMYLISSHKKGISSLQLSRDIEVTQKTAWHMLHKIRSLYAQDGESQFDGTVECDEVYIGGKEKWKHKSMRTPHTQGRSTKTKTPVFGMMERTAIKNEDGEIEPMSYVRALVVEKCDKSTLQSIILRFVKKGSFVMTDELSAYNGLGGLGYYHGIVRHSEEEYANDNIFTNSIEGFWSHFRRMITGCYHNVSDGHLQAYIDEAVFRWNTRKMSESRRFAHMFRMSVGLIVRWSEIRVGLVAA